MAHPLDANQARDETRVAREDRSLGELFAELSRETTTLVRQEVELAKTEMTQKATRV
ncbi:MAG: phage holin family protein, partial [Chloroflexi bacterium]|nr:phage holin family protein [Chloroflexota bacterium]